MLISTRGRYALRVMIDLAQHRDEGYVPMKDVAERQGISLKYIGGIMPVLTKNKLVEGIHGKGGGYRLTKAPNEYKIGDILRLTEGDLSPVACLKADAKPCPRKAQCATVGLWEELKEVIGDFLDKKTLSDLMN